MFPLPGVFLYPGQVLPLHVFEPRYRQLVNDQLDGPGRFVLATLLPGAAAAPSLPPVLPVAGFGEIVRHERLPDGRFHIWLLGLCRVYVQEAPSDRLYRQVACAPFAELPVADAEAPDLSRRLRRAAEARLGQELPLPADAPPSLLADLLLQVLGATPDLLSRCYAEPSVATRAALVLAAAQAAPPPSAPDAAGPG
jgi:Lon protease-like protein